MALSVLSRHFKFFKVSMAQETVEGRFFWGPGVGATEGVWIGEEGQKWLFFTLHSDQSFLDTPELRGSRIGTRPAGGRHKTGVRRAADCKLVY